MALAGAFGLPSAYAQAVFLVVDVDMQPGVPGIQNTVTAAQNAPVTADLWLTLPAVVGNPGLEAYTFSIQFDNAELSLTAFPALTQFGPGAPWVLNAHVAGDEVAAPPLNPAWGEVRALGASDGSWVTPIVPPPATSWQVASVSFTAGVVVNDGAPDVKTGLFDNVRDGFLDGTGLALIPVANIQFNSGFVVPEPSATGVVLGAVALMGTLLVRRPRH
jgi:hypothetical protein